MKVKLLKKLRKRFPIQERNGEYRTKIIQGDMFEIWYAWDDWSDWLGYVKNVRRERILEIARRCYKRPKKIIL